MDSGECCPARYARRDEPVGRRRDCDQFLQCVLPVGWDRDDLNEYALWYEGDDGSPLKEDS